MTAPVGYDPIEEIDRKTLNELQRVMHSASTARISVRQAYGATCALWESCSGIAHKETMDLVGNACQTLAQKIANDGKPDASITMYCFASTRVFLIERRGSVVKLRIYGSAGESEQNFDPTPDDLTPELSAQRRINSIAEKLTLKGIRRIA